MSMLGDAVKCYLAQRNKLKHAQYCKWADHGSGSMRNDGSDVLAMDCTQMMSTTLD